MGAGASSLPDNDVILAELTRLQNEDPARAAELLAAVSKQRAASGAKPSSNTKAYLLSEVDPVLSPMVKQMAAEKPADVAGWMRNHLGGGTGGGGGGGGGAEPAPSSSECRLRIIMVTDVYVLDNLPALHTLIRENSIKNTMTVLPGDFCAPSLLSSIDHGFGMVNVLNLLPLSHVCFGNHEADIPYDELCKRIKQFNGRWINSNMQDFADGKLKEWLPEHDVVTVTNGEHVRRVGVCGVMSNDPGLFRKGAFGGCRIDDPNEKLAEMKRKLEEDEKVDFVVPLTHQYVPQDTVTCNKDFGFPFILGGHDHHVVMEEINGTMLLKPGADAENAMIIDVVWADADPATKPTFSHKLLKVGDYPPDALVARAVKKHHSLVEALEHADLAAKPPGAHWSSTDIRVSQTTMGRMLTSAIRDGLSLGSSPCDAVIMNAGGIRANHDYPEEHKFFTYGDLKREIPFDAEFVVIELPGSVLAETIAYSRHLAPAEKASMFMQIDDGCEVDEANKLLKVGGEPFDAERVYHVGVNYTTINGMDNVVPLVDYCTGVLKVAGKMPSEDAGRPAKTILIHFWAVKIFGSFYFKVSDNWEGKAISKEEMKDGLVALGLEASDVLVNFIFDNVDADHDGFITRDEAVKALTEDMDPNTKKQLVLYGGPACGKGTQCQFLVERFGLIHLSTGQMLRAAVEAGSPLGVQAKEFMDRGELVPDDVISGVVTARLQEPDCQALGWLLDGFPRTVGQAEDLATAGFVPDRVLLLDAPDELLVDRAVGRRYDPVTKQLYHMKLSPPPSDDAELLARLVHREDDTEENATARIATFHTNTDAIKAHYSTSWIRVDAAQDKPAVWKDVQAAVEK